MNGSWLDFEKPIVELESQIKDLRSFADGQKMEVSDELRRLEEKADKLRHEIYGNLSRWQRVQLARHPQRPYTLDYIERIFTDFQELHGDRNFRDDPAIVGGTALLGGQPVMVIGHQKGRETRENIRRNFGMPNPEGYRKALRLMEMASRFSRPIITFVDTPGAYPGIGAEERGQAEAIARNLREMSRLEVPVIAVITGEGGSGGALALAVGDRVLMLENSIYAVISPEGCASILWKDASKREEAAEALRLSSRDLAEMEIIDRVIPEPLGGAHRDQAGMSLKLKEALIEEIASLSTRSPESLISSRIEKISRMGVFDEAEPT
ncbi:MAG: acetyl-CoA carboxylase carboxyltransferase subunit alpha [Candidatus Krumholzibacteria bacterium]|nr:acetyl-CoA carboxylase carboxyltransferase subunit alpha [Candidatus Krumholzibacteria bacterium]MDP6670053.1 acetyl-CoA carboxylase carboxyltransferase subunit alpha [Candidatus Krumholzibacteria bacterium]MDP6797094.1 acetyl-CoA carboxylase carboxyltransferase subunit alpha [Candidatus Krumholzibacteria bacterium]MDP7020733.1 acetyl-CoA carboxylase carboxyltransferase subunit alpha [Candidatus Krumholzibacteria bacterium]